ncbi:hypothetical protein BN1723_019201, partial [Verticillium longisporum]
HAVVDARPRAHLEPQVQLPVDLLQRRPLHRRVQAPHRRRHQRRGPLRGHPQGALGHAVVDQQGPLPRVDQDAQGERHPVRRQGLLPLHVPLEQRHVLQAPGPRQHALLLARRAQGALLLRRRLRRLPLHAGQQQDVRLHH